MTRAESLGSARQYLFDAMNGLDGATKALGLAEFTDASQTAGELHKGAEALHFEIKLAHVLAHRAEHPEFYDEHGQWIGRQDGTEQS